MDIKVVKSGKKKFLNLFGINSNMSNDEILRILNDVFEIRFSDINYFQNILDDRYLPNENYQFMPLIQDDEKTCFDSALWFEYFRCLASSSDVQIKSLNTFKVPYSKKVKIFGYEELNGNARDELVLVDNSSSSKTIIKKLIVSFSKSINQIEERNNFYADYFRLKEHNIFINYYIFTNALNKFSALRDENLMYYLYVLKQKFPEKVNVICNEKVLSLDEILSNLHNSFFVLDKYKNPEIFVAKKLVDDYCLDLTENDEKFLTIRQNVEKIHLYKKYDFRSFYDFNSVYEFLNNNYDKYQDFNYFTDNVNKWNDHIGECIKAKIIEINNGFKNISNEIIDINNLISNAQNNPPTIKGGSDDWYKFWFC